MISPSRHREFFSGWIMLIRHRISTIGITIHRRMVSVTVEFLGGLDVIVNKQRIHQVQIDEEGADVKRLITYIVDQMITNKNDVEVFLEDGSIRPGILTLINDTDWELEGGEDYVLEDKDVISFTSTLHGG